MTSKRNSKSSKPPQRGTAASLRSTKPASKRKEATPPTSSDSEPDATVNVVDTRKKKSPRVQFDITPGSGVYIWNRKGDGPKFGFTTEALDLWLQPIIIKKDSHPDARVKYSALIGGCLKPQLASAMEIENTVEGWESVDNDQFPSRARLAIEPSTDYESLLSNLKLSSYLNEARKKLKKTSTFTTRPGEDPVLFDKDFKVPLLMFDLLTGDFLQLAKEDKDKNKVPVTQRKLVETLILACNFSDMVSSAIKSNRTDELDSTVRLTRTELQKKESSQTVHGAAGQFVFPNYNQVREALPAVSRAPITSPLQHPQGSPLFNLLEMFKSRVPPAAPPLSQPSPAKVTCGICGWNNHSDGNCLRRAWPGANLTGSTFPAGKQRLTLESCFPDEAVRKRMRDDERQAIRSIKRTSNTPAFNNVTTSGLNPDEVLVLLNSIMPQYTAVNPSDYAFQGLAVRRIAVGALVVDALWDNGANICFVDPDVAERIVHSNNGRIHRLKQRVPVIQGAIRTSGFDEILVCNVTLVHKGVQHHIQDQMFAVYSTGHDVVIGSDVLESKTGIIDVRRPGLDDDHLVQQAAVLTRLTKKQDLNAPKIISLSPNQLFMATAVAAFVPRPAETCNWHAGDKHGSTSADWMVHQLKGIYPDPFDDDFSAAAKFEEYSILLEKDLRVGSVQSQKYTPAMLSEMQRQLIELVRLGVITKCDTIPKFLSPVLMVMQKNKIRMCINYKKLNLNCNARAYSMPDLQCSVDELKGFKFYASFDLKKCYNQFLIKESDRSWAAFSTPFGNYMPTRVQYLGFREHRRLYSHTCPRHFAYFQVAATSSYLLTTRLSEPIQCRSCTQNVKHS